MGNTEINYDFLVFSKKTSLKSVSGVEKETQVTSMVLIKTVEKLGVIFKNSF